MKAWYIEDRGGEVYVLHGETYTDKKIIYPDIKDSEDINFYILYNDNKTVGYKLTYRYDDKFPKFLTYNSFGIVYSKKKVAEVNPTFEVIFEDATVRFLTWEHSLAKSIGGKLHMRDYFLVGRWRNGEVTHG